MKYCDLREFCAALEAEGELRRVLEPVSTRLEMTALSDRVSRSTGPALWWQAARRASILGVALNEVFVPILRKQFPEIVDFYLPPEGCSHRMAIISIKKAYPGHAKRVMFGLRSFLRRFTYAKLIVVSNDDVGIRRWSEVIWAITTRMDPRPSAPCDPGHPKQRGQEMAAGLENTAQSPARLPYRRGAKDGPTLNGVRAIPKRGLLGAGCCPERLPTHEGVAG